MGTGKGLLDSLIAEGGVKSRDLSWVYIWAWIYGYTIDTIDYVHGIGN